jgi:hypothetical protein
VTVAQAARALGVSELFVLDLVKSGAIRLESDGIPPEDLRAVIAARRNDQAPDHSGA